MSWIRILDRSLWLIAGVAICTVGWKAWTAVPVRNDSVLPVHLRTEFSGTQYTMVFVASTSCAGIQRHELPGALRRIRQGLERLDPEVPVFSVGVSVDSDPVEGWELMQSMGSFDEVSSGGGYLNTVAQHVMVRNPGAMAVPQVIVLRRRVRVMGGIKRVKTTDVVTRFVGAERIIAAGSGFQGPGMGGT